jgi:predicted nucleic acid-binding protein
LQILVDTSVWVDYFDGVLTRETDYLDSVLGQGWLVVGDLILAEVLAGYAEKESFEAARRALLQFASHQLGSLEIALLAAEHTRRLRTEHGAPVPGPVDSLIAAFCLRWNLTLLHADPAFTPFEEHLGLQTALPRRMG